MKKLSIVLLAIVLLSAYLIVICFKQSNTVAVNFESHCSIIAYDYSSEDIIATTGRCLVNECITITEMNVIDCPVSINIYEVRKSNKAYLKDQHQETVCRVNYHNGNMVINCVKDHGIMFKSALCKAPLRTIAIRCDRDMYRQWRKQIAGIQEL